MIAGEEGHIAYVASVNSDGTVTLQDDNWVRRPPNLRHGHPPGHRGTPLHPLKVAPRAGALAEAVTTAGAGTLAGTPNAAPAVHLDAPTVAGTHHG
jgi:surface antigen